MNLTLDVVSVQSPLINCAVTSDPEIPAGSFGNMAVCVREPFFISGIGIGISGIGYGPNPTPVTAFAYRGPGQYSLFARLTIIDPSGGPAQVTESPDVIVTV